MKGSEQREGGELGAENGSISISTQMAENFGQG